MKDREKAMSMLQEEAGLQEIVKLVGQDSLSADDRLTLETAKMIREDFLQQNAFVDVDSYSGYERQRLLLGLILNYDRLCRTALEKGASLSGLMHIPARERIGRAKTVEEDKYAEVYAAIGEEMRAEIEEIIAGGDEQ